MADRDIFARIDAILDGYQFTGETAPFFAKVFRSEPLNLTPANRLCAYWVQDIHDPPEGSMTFGNWMYEHTIRVKCFWQLTPDEGTRENRELELFTVSHELPGLFLGDVSLNGTVTDCLVANFLVETEQWPPYVDNPGWWRTLTFDLHVKNLEGEVITR